MFPITTITSSILALFFLALSIRVILHRRHYKVSIGTGDIKPFEMMIRGHGNFAEYVPLTLLLLLCAEANQGAPTLLISAALSLTLGRFSHAYAFSGHKGLFRFRQIGMILNFTSILVLAIMNLILVVL